MHVLFWGLGFLLFPDFLNVAASTGALLLNSSTGKVRRRADKAARSERGALFFPFFFWSPLSPPLSTPLAVLFGSAEGAEENE